MLCTTKLIRHTWRYLIATGERFVKGSSNPCSDPSNTLQKGEFGINLKDGALQIGGDTEVLQVPCVAADIEGATDDMKILYWVGAAGGIKKFVLAAETGQANAADNLGAGLNWFVGKLGEDLLFRSLIVGNGISASTTSEELTINADLPPASPNTITGSRGGNVALGNLLTELDSLGLIVDGTSA